MEVKKGVISRNICEFDTMLVAGEEDSYYEIGRGALRQCLKALNGRQPRRILDFPSGFGRVMRWLRAEWPEAEIYGAETDSRCLDFIESEFEAKRIQADPRLNMKIPQDMDLIFSGSLLTHFDEWQWGIYIDMCIQALSADGVFVFTTHGRIAALMAKERHKIFGDIVDTRELYERYKLNGFAFLPYDANYPTFGLTLTKPEWIMRTLQNIPSIKIIGFEEGGWGQDVWIVQRAPWPMVL